jgi:hypothetical protein
MKSLIQRMVNGLGYEVRRKVVAPGQADEDVSDFDREALEKIRIVHRHTMLPYGRLYSLYDQAVYCEKAGVPGAFVECGTWKGGAVGLMALANLAHGKARRRIHLFDSFDSIPEPDETVDGAKAIKESRAAGGGTQGRLVPLENFYESRGVLQTNRDLLENAVGYSPDCLRYHQGWFQDTLPRDAAEVGEIAILRLDGDWYASTKVCLEHLYPHVVSGGFVIIDDYGCYEGCKKAVDEYMARNGITAYLHQIDSAGRYLIKP